MSPTHVLCVSANAGPHVAQISCHGPGHQLFTSPKKEDAGRSGTLHFLLVLFTALQKIRKGNNQRVWVLEAHPQNDQGRQALEQHHPLPPQAMFQLGSAIERGFIELELD